MCVGLQLGITCWGGYIWCLLNVSNDARWRLSGVIEMVLSLVVYFWFYFLWIVVLAIHLSVELRS